MDKQKKWKNESLPFQSRDTLNPLSNETDKIIFKNRKKKKIKQIKPETV